MSWVMVGVAGVGALTSMQQQKAKNAAEANAMEANSVAIRNSPWTGMKTNMMSGSGGSQLGAALQGGLAGAQFGSQFGGKGGFGAVMGSGNQPSPQPPTTASAGSAPQGGTPWSSLYRPNMYSNRS